MVENDKFKIYLRCLSNVSLAVSTVESLGLGIWIFSWANLPRSNWSSDWSHFPYPLLLFFFVGFFFFLICYLTSLLLLNLVFLELNAAKQSYSHPSESKDRKNFPMYSEWSGIWTQVFEGSTSLDHSLNLCCVTSVEKHSLETTEISK